MENLQRYIFIDGEPMQSRKPHSKYHSDEMDEHTDAYVQFVLETLAEARQTCPDPVLLMEQRLDFSSWVPGGFGTGDCIIIADDLLHIILATVL